MILEANPTREVKLQDIKILDYLSDEEHALIEEHAHTRYYKKRSILFHEGSINSGIYIVKKGVIKTYKVGPYGRYYIIGLMKPGDIMAYHSLFSNRSVNNTSAKACEDSEVCYIPNSIVTKLLESNWSFTKKMMELISSDVNTSNTFLTGFVQKSLRERTAELLLSLKEDFGVDEFGGLQLRITRKDLACMVGTVPESLIRVLADFKRERLVDLVSRKIIFLDTSELRKLANI